MAGASAQRHLLGGDAVGSVARILDGLATGLAPTIGIPNATSMGLASLGLDIGIFCDFLYSILLFHTILGLEFLGLALSRPQVSEA